MNLIPRFIVSLFGIAVFLVLVKPFKSIWPIVMGEGMYWLARKYLCLLFRDVFLFIYNFIILMWPSWVGVGWWFMVFEFF
jgi:hypothetical protein